MYLNEVYFQIHIFSVFLSLFLFRDTITASGPNSFGKGKHGFVDRQKIIEKELQEEMDRISGDKKPAKWLW